MYYYIEKGYSTEKNLTLILDQKHSNIDFSIFLYVLLNTGLDMSIDLKADTEFAGKRSFGTHQFCIRPNL